MTYFPDPADRCSAPLGPSELVTRIDESCGRMARRLNALRDFSPAIAAPIAEEFQPLWASVDGIKAAIVNGIAAEAEAGRLGRIVREARNAIVIGKVEPDPPDYRYGNRHESADNRALDAAGDIDIPAAVIELRQRAGLVGSLQAAANEALSIGRDATARGDHAWAYIEAIRDQLRDEVRAGRLKRGAVTRIMRAAEQRALGAIDATDTTTTEGSTA